MLEDGVRENIATYLASLRQQFCNYFPGMHKDGAGSWMRNPFTIDIPYIASGDLTAGEQKSLIELSCEETLKASFNVHTLLLFATTYLCEEGFSSLVVIKTKYRSRVDAEPNLRLKLTSIDPDIPWLCSQMQVHSSH